MNIDCLTKSPNRFFIAINALTAMEKSKLFKFYFKEERKVIVAIGNHPVLIVLTRANLLDSKKAE